MSKSDVEMEDPRELPNDSGQESKSKVFDAKIESKAEISPTAAAVLGDVKVRENGSDDLNNSKIEVKDKTEVKSEVNDQINPKSEADKPMGGSVSGEINTKSDNEEQINTETKAEEQTAPISAVEKQIDAKHEGVEQKATNGGLEENTLSVNGVEGENYQENVEKITNEDVAEMKPEETGKVELYDAEPVSGGDLTMGNADAGDKPGENRQLPTELSVNEDPQKQDAQSDEVPQGKDAQSVNAVDFDEEKTIKDKEQSAGTVLASRETNGDDKTAEIAAKQDGEESSLANQQVAKPELLSSCSSAKAVENNGEMAISVFTQPTLHLTGEGDDGTPEEQVAFMKDLESFYRERAMDFKPPKFYGQPLNCLKLWRLVIRLGGYDRVTGSKLWRQVGESFHPPKTCTTVSWTFRIFYEKSILEFERHKTQSGELQLPMPMLPEVCGIDGEGNGYQGSGPGRARRDSASRAMQGWHAQRLSDSGEVGDQIIKFSENIFYFKNIA
ncbi:hypothetical protein ACS0TY_023244 [Phlomoides rotata]